MLSNWHYILSDGMPKEISNDSVISKIMHWNPKWKEIELLLELESNKVKDAKANSSIENTWWSIETNNIFLSRRSNTQVRQIKECKQRDSTHIHCKDALFCKRLRLKIVQL